MAMPFINFSPTLPKFSGGVDEESEQFMAQFDRVLGLYGNDITAEQRLYLLEVCVAGSAKTVLTRLLRDQDAIPNRTPAEKYTAVRQGLLDAFPTIVDRQSLRDQLQARVKLPTETYAQYAQEVLRLCQKLGIVAVPEQIEEVHKGVDLAVAAALRPTDYATVEAFLRAVHSLEASHKAALRAHAQHSLLTGAPVQRTSPCMPLPCAPAAVAVTATRAPPPPNLVPASQPASVPSAEDIRSLIYQLAKLSVAAATEQVFDDYTSDDSYDADEYDLAPGNGGQQ